MAPEACAFRCFPGFGPDDPANGIGPSPLPIHDSRDLASEPWLPVDSCWDPLRRVSCNDHPPIHGSSTDVFCSTFELQPLQPLRTDVPPKHRTYFGSRSWDVPVHLSDVQFV